MPSTMDDLLGDLDRLELDGGENGKNLMKKTFRELNKNALSYDKKEPNSTKADNESSNNDEDREEDALELVNDEDSEDDGLELVQDYEDSDDEVITVIPQCGKDPKPKTQNRDTPYTVTNHTNIPKRLGGVIQEFAQRQSAASKFFEVRNYTKALEWLIDAKNMHFSETCQIEQLGKLKNTINQSNRNKYSQFFKIFCEPNHDGVTALFYASIHNNMRISEFLVKEIFQNGFPSPQQAMNYFNKPDPAGNTLLHEMAYLGDIVAQTLAKLLEFRYPDASHTLFKYQMKNLKHQSPIHYSLENCLQNSQQKTIEIFHTVDPDILKIVDGKGNNLLYCFIQSCLQFYPLHVSVESNGLENVKKYLKQLLNYPEINKYGCLELLNMLQQYMEPSVWAAINTCLGGAKMENNQTKPDDEIQVMFSNIQSPKKSAIERKPSQEKQTPVVLVIRETPWVTPQTSVQDDMEGEMIPVMVTERSLGDVYGDTTKNKGYKSKGSSGKNSRHNSKDDGYLTASPAAAASSPGTSPQEASTSAKKYSGKNVSSPLPACQFFQQSSTEQSYMYTQEVNTIPLSVQDMSSPGPNAQSNLQSGKYTHPQFISSSKSKQNKPTSPSTTTNSIVVPNQTMIASKPSTATTFSLRSPAPTANFQMSPPQMSPAPTAYAQMPPAPTAYAQMSPAPTANSQMSPAPTIYSHIPATPSTYSQIPATPMSYSQMHSPNTYSQMPATTIVYSQVPATPIEYTQMSPTAYSKMPTHPITYTQMSPTAYSEMPAYTQMSPMPIAYSPMPPSPNTQPIYSPTMTTYPHVAPCSTIYPQNAQSQAWNTIPMVLKLLPETACPDASEVLDAIKGTNQASTSQMQTVVFQECTNSYFQCNTCDQTFPTKTQLLSHAQQVHNMTAGKDTVEILIDPASLSQAGKQSSAGADWTLTTQDFENFLAEKKDDDEDNSIPDLEALGLLSTPQVEKGPFFSTRK